MFELNESDLAILRIAVGDRLLTSMKVDSAIYCHRRLLSTVRFFVKASLTLAAQRRRCFHYISGGAERNHRKRVKIYSQPRRGDRPVSVCRPSGAPVGVFDCVRWFHHRLISSVPPGRRSIPDLCRNLSCPVCVASITGVLKKTREPPSRRNFQTMSE
jgi:hypothetical protein